MAFVASATGLFLQNRAFLSHRDAEVVKASSRLRTSHWIDMWGQVTSVGPGWGAVVNLLHQGWHPMWMWVPFLAAPLLIQLRSNAPGKAVEADLRTWSKACVGDLDGTLDS